MRTEIFSTETGGIFTSGETIQQFLNENYLKNNNALSFTIQHIAASPYLTYYTFTENWNNIPVENSMIKVAVDHAEKIQWISGNYYPEIQYADEQAERISMTEAISIAANNHLNGDISTGQIMRIDVNGDAEIFNLINISDRNAGNFTTCMVKGNQIINSNDHRAYLTGPDSLVQAKVFLPDPLTTAAVTYGGEYSDNNDSDNDALNNERFLVMMRVAFENDTFFLRNDSVVITDLNVPTVPVAFSLIPDFDYLRSDEGFEDVNAFYHITHMNEYISSLGYSGLQNFPIRIDPHGANGDDQSFYTGGAFPNIQYGEGGVDDAEDADVLLHEYGHAISDHAAPGTNAGIERHALDEGYGDYFAVSYSRMYSDFNWQNVFSWDGHNEFWFGRNANTNKHYPEDNSDNIYAACEIWSGALMDIFDALGKENTDKLVLEALYGSTPEMTMPQAAQLILAAESTIFGGTFHDIVYDLLDARGLINPVGISNALTENKIQFNNSAGYTNAGEPLIISLPEISDYTLQLFSADGKLIKNLSGTGKIISFEIHPDVAGIYFLKVTAGEKTAGFSIINK